MQLLIRSPTRRALVLMLLGWLFSSVPTHSALAGTPSSCDSAACRAGGDGSRPSTGSHEPTPHGDGGGSSSFPWSTLPSLIYQLPNSGEPNNSPQEVEVPELKGLEVQEGEARVKDHQLVMVVHQTLTTGEIRTITTQEPKAGTRVPIGSRITVTAEPKKPWTTVPKLLGRSVADAKRLVQGAMLGLASRNGDPSGPEDTVAHQEPGPDTHVPAGSQVSVSWAPAMTIVPNLKSLTNGQAKIALIGARLSLAGRDQPGVDGRLDRVERQEPAAGTRVRKGSSVTVTLAVAPIVGLPPTPPDRSPIPAPSSVATPGVPTPLPPPTAVTSVLETPSGAVVPTSPPAPTSVIERPVNPPRSLADGWSTALRTVAAAGLAALGIGLALYQVKRTKKNRRRASLVRIRVTAKRDAGAQTSHPRTPALAQPTIGLRVRWMSAASTQSMRWACQGEN